MVRRNEPNRGAIIATAVAAYLAIAGIAVVDPILPAIGEAIGVTAWQVELLFTAYIAVMAVGMIPAVIATGRFGYKKVLIAGVLTVGVAAVLASFSNTIGQLTALRGLWGLGNAMFFATALVLMVARANDRNWVVALFEDGARSRLRDRAGAGRTARWLSWRLPFAVCGVLMGAARRRGRRVRLPGSEREAHASQAPARSVGSTGGRVRGPDHGHRHVQLHLLYRARVHAASSCTST